jgi:queuine tRNA-ribosyltransferase
MLGAILLTWHNLTYYQDLMAGMRRAVEAGGFADFMAAFAEEQALGDIAPL